MLSPGHEVQTYQHTYLPAHTVCLASTYHHLNAQTDDDGGDAHNVNNALITDQWGGRARHV
jgi:hypothetical protein